MLIGSCRGCVRGMPDRQTKSYCIPVRLGISAVYNLQTDDIRTGVRPSDEAAMAGTTSISTLQSASRWIVRNASFDDLDALTSLEKQFSEADRISRRSWRNFCSTPGTVWVAEMQSKVVAAAVVLFRQNSHVARLYSLVTSPPSRGQGLACALIEACLLKAESIGCTTMRLEVREDNHSAIRFYMRRGFVHTGAKPGYYSDGAKAIVMERRISASEMQ